MRIVDIEEFKGYEISQRILGEHSERVNKVVDIMVNVETKRVWFEVQDHRKIIAEVPTLKEAIDIFNEL